MQLSRSRYVTVCQQLLVTGAVLVFAVSAAGVRTLDIVAPDAQMPERPAFSPACGAPLAPGAAQRSPSLPHGAAATGCRRVAAPGPATRR